jgi:single-stranded DNA-binding protein
MGTLTRDLFIRYMKSSWEVTLAHFSIEKNRREGGD